MLAGRAVVSRLNRGPQPLTLLVAGNGDGSSPQNQPRNWNTDGGTQDYSSLLTSDGTSYISAPMVAQTSRDTSFTLQPMPADFGTMASLGIQVVWRGSNRVNDWIYLEAKVMRPTYVADDTDVLAGVPGPGYASENYISIGNYPPATWTTSSVIPFSVILDTTAPKAVWDTAVLVLRTGWQSFGDSPTPQLQIDHVVLTGIYNSV